MTGREGQRQAYLRELGIQSYFPRRALPGAKPSPRYVTGNLARPEQEGLAVESNVQRLSALIGSPPLSSEVSRDSTIPSPVVATPDARAAVVVTSPTPRPIPEQIASEATRFAFAYFPISEQLAVINELPWAKSAAVSPACRQLLAAILKALSVPCDEKSLTSMVFTWPLTEGPDFDGSAQSARHTLDGFLARRFKLRPVRYLLVLAEQSAEFLFPAQFEWRQEGMKLHPHHEVEVIVTRSLNAMDAVPDIKRSVWQALQPLRAALVKPAVDGIPSSSNGQ